MAISDGPSAEALAFVELEPVAMPPLTVETVADWRRLIGGTFLPRAERAVARSGVSVETANVGGVDCLLVTPPDWDGERRGLYFYGGGYFTGSPEQDMIVAAPLAAGSGTRLVLPRYPLAPEHPHPVAIEHGWRVWQAMAAQGPFVLAGESAGGNLALVLLARALARGSDLPLAAALLSPWCDMTAGAAARHNAEGHDPTLAPEIMEIVTAFYAGAADRADPALSPVFSHWTDRMPPVRMTTGTRDLLRDQVLHLDARLRAAGARVETRVWPGLWHVFEFYDEIPEAALSLGDLSGFLAAAWD